MFADEDVPSLPQSAVVSESQEKIEKSMKSL